MGMMTGRGLALGAVMGLALCLATTACGGGRDGGSSATISQIADSGDAVLSGRTLTLLEGQIVQLAVTAELVDAHPVRADDVTSIHPRHLDMTSSDSTVATGYWHQDTRFAVVGHMPGEATLTLLSASGKTYGSFDVEVLAQ